jgi:histidine phosphotransferase ChpT
VTSSAALAAARLQFARIAFGAAGSAGAELDLNEVGRTVCGLLEGSKTEIGWEAAPVNWPKDWAKLLMNSALLAADCLPRGGRVRVTTTTESSAPAFLVRAMGQGARVHEDVDRALRGENAGSLDGRSIQPYLTYKLARLLNTELTLARSEGVIEISAG